MTTHDYAQIERDLDAAREALAEHEERWSTARDAVCNAISGATHLDYAERTDFRVMLVEVIEVAFSPHWNELDAEVNRLERILERRHEEQERLP